MKIYVYSMIGFMLLVTGCSDKNISRNVDLNEAVEETVTEISAETVVFDQYSADNEDGESDCADILETLPPVMEGKWLITEGVHLRAVERIEESLEGTVIEFSKEAIRVNGEALVNPTISRDKEVSYDSFIDTKMRVGKIGMQDGDFARCFTVKGWLDSCNSEYYIQILYFDGKPYLISGCDYGMEKME